MSHRNCKQRKAFSLIELLVVMVILGILMALLIPGIQAAREAARNTSSKNNLKQLGLAMANHEASKSYFAPSWLGTAPASGNDNIDGWSIFALLLPYLEQDVVQSKIDFSVSYNLAPSVTTADGATARLSALRVPAYLSPSEPRDEVRFDGGEPNHYPINYAVNLGTWFVWDPATGQGGNGAAYPNSRLKAGSFADGMSNTLAMSEVKAWNAYYRNAALAAPAMPTTASAVCSLGGDFKSNSGHTEWVDGRAHQIGFTTVFRPNTYVKCTISGTDYDVDWSNWQEGKGLNQATPNLTPTYAAVTARSYFAGMVNVLMMDGSVRATSDEVNLGVWRAISTRNGQELLPDDLQK
jgi:prepilin-type N-terminal cleavage/methylation domain-containing protein/prepilin-type processing-associated H-X9-DG protein